MAQGALAEEPFEGMILTFVEESIITAVYQVRWVLAHERSPLQEIAILELGNWCKPASRSAKRVTRRSAVEAA